MNRTAWAAAAVVVLNLAVNSVHGASHAQTHVDLAPWQMAYVAATVYLLPILAAALYWTRWRRAGAGMLAASLLAAVLFGIYFHFVAETSDHVRHQQSDAQGALFVVTAILLIPAGLLGVWFGAWSWRRMPPASDLHDG